MRLHVQKKKPFNREGQLCWRCRKATNPKDNDCPWSKRLEPVPGWKAKKIKIKYNDLGLAKSIYESYEIRKCPLFEEG